MAAAALETSMTFRKGESVRPYLDEWQKPWFDYAEERWLNWEIWREANFKQQ